MATDAPVTPQRHSRRPRDMALSMLVLLVPVFLIVGFYRFLGHEDPPAIDTSEVYGSVQRAGQFQALRPESLPDGWRIVSATFTDGVLRIGVTAPDNGALQVVESANPASVLAPTAIGPAARPGAEVTVDGVLWHRYDNARPGEEALVQEANGRTVIVVGQAPEKQQRELIQKLKA